MSGQLGLGVNAAASLCQWGLRWDSDRDHLTPAGSWAGRLADLIMMSLVKRLPRVWAEIWGVY